MQRTRSLARHSHDAAASTPSSPQQQQSLPVVDSVLDYEKLHRIGEGTYGVVYKARHIHTGQVVALKKVRFNRCREGVPVTSVRELAVLQQSRHPNIVQLLKVVTGTRPDSVFLVFEYCDHDLGRVLDSHQLPFSEGEIKCLFKQLLSAVAYLHSRWVLHRDLKLSNLLYTSTGQLKLCDFGLARHFHPDVGRLTPRVVTLWYRAPELLLGSDSYGPAIDCWSLGCILGELLKGEPLFPASTEPECLQMHCQLLGTPLPRIWPAIRALPLSGNMRWPNQPYNLLRRQFPELSDAGLSLLNGLLTYDPDQRLTAHQALNSQYFQERPYPRRTTDMPSFPSASCPGSSSRPAGGPGTHKAPLHTTTYRSASLRGSSSSKPLQHQSILGHRAYHVMAAAGSKGQAERDTLHSSRDAAGGEPGGVEAGLPPPLLFQRYQMAADEEDGSLALELDGKRHRSQL